MTLALDLSNDYLVFDGLEPVTCYPATSPAVGNVWTPGNAVPLAAARIGKIEVVEVEPTAGVYDRADTRIRLPAKLAAAAVGPGNVATPYTPAIGDVIESADAAAWVVLTVGYPRFGGWWTCQCRQLLMPGGLCDSVTFLSASVTNIAGSKVTTHAAVQTKIPARIQPMGEQEIMEFQAKAGFDAHFRIYTATDVDAKYGDLFEDEASGLQYEVQSSGARKRLDVLSTYFCRIRP